MYNLKIKNLVKHYNQPLLEGVNLSHTGKGVIALIGDNGSGKSTLLKIIANQEQQDSGDVIWDTKPTIGYLTQEITDYESLSGGSGARHDKDGLSGTMVHMMNVTNLPVEALEIEFPLRVERVQLRPDSGGAGRYRGAA